jgi:cytochrome P450
MAEMRVVLREVLRRVDVATTTARGEGQKVKHVILTPKRGARITVSRIKTPPSTMDGSPLNFHHAARE